MRARTYWSKHLMQMNMSEGQLRCKTTTAPNAAWCEAMRAVSAISRADGPVDPLAPEAAPPPSETSSPNSGRSAAAVPACGTIAFRSDIGNYILTHYHY
jgi:hypothetical protein